MKRKDENDKENDKTQFVLGLVIGRVGGYAVQ